MFFANNILSISLKHTRETIDEVRVYIVNTGSYYKKKMQFYRIVPSYIFDWILHGIGHVIHHNIL